MTSKPSDSKPGDSKPGESDSAESRSSESDGHQLADGAYDVLVVDTEPDGSQSLRLELVITIGPQKGQIVAISMSGADPDLDSLSFLGLPGHLVVADGVPSFTLDE